MRDEFNWPLKQKYLIPGRVLHRTNIDPPQGTPVYVIGLSSKIAKKSSNSGGVGHAARRRGVRSRQRAIPSAGWPA